MTENLSTYLAAALAKYGEPIELTDAELDTGLTIQLKTTETGIRVHVAWEKDDDDDNTQ
jgi:hypothetical protein